jgi:hypothetical protein
MCRPARRLLTATRFSVCRSRILRGDTVCADQVWVSGSSFWEAPATLTSHASDDGQNDFCFAFDCCILQLGSHARESAEQLDRRAAHVGINLRAASRPWLDIRFQSFRRI